MSDDWPAAGILLAFRYRLVSRLETGGMAEIWHAQDELLARPVALKLPTGLDRARADVLQLAWREARMGARLSHPNIAAVHDYDEAVRPDGSVAPFVVMELLAGETLAARLERAPLLWREAATIGAAVAGALTAAHTSGVVHRDVKPGNVMLTPNGIKILDFGISAVTGEPDDDETGATFGTPAYVAPERLDGKPAEPATDVYGLGVLLFEMVTGQPPYPVDTWEELAQARAGGVTALPETLPRRFRELVARCLVDEPDRRPTAAEVGEILTELAAPSEAEPVPGALSSGWHGRESAAGPHGGGLDLGPRGGGLDFGPRGGESASGLRGGGPTSGPHGGEPAAGPHGGAAPSGPHRREPDLGAPLGAEASGGRFGDGAGAGGGGRRAAGRAAGGRRRLLLWSGLVALAVSMLAVFAAIGSSRQTQDAQRAPATAQPPASPSPTPAVTASPTPRTAVSTTPPPLDVDVALARVRSAVEAGEELGQIREDVAVDLLNLLGPLDRADSGEAADQVAEVRRKLRERVGEGSLDADRAEVLRDRLDDLDQAVGSG